MTGAGPSWEGHTEADLVARWARDRVTLLASVGSTNDEAKLLADQDAPAGTIVIAGEQTKGRGRAGRSWASPAGAGLYLSMVFRPEVLKDAGPVSILAGLGIVRALDSALPNLDPRLKWPNDLYADGLKFGGILTEAAWTGKRPRYLVAGVGINVRPLGAGISERIARKATSIDEETGDTTSLLDVADAVVAGLESYLAAPVPVLASGDLRDLDRYDGMRDRRAALVLSAENEPLPGTCVGIAPDGALLFRPDRGALRRVMDGTLIPE
ncbi:MAG: biotin--[acetyl-CoA-carboxylase] ligase [Gemmatimonadales bacterium]|nr:MAG: biotin--[acetyl-CoA-carboxylase] ligase [Gemmatimonadales bacterium]